ncbi:hypothetical protein [uncultured Sanguibacteroides sp.]|uniref:hypothetical protein n=1 Tax=uncultured Sanguibacteroides sp. TaxID=1635151 RepID=UPI0025E394D4|nr:hypothetical protein [uncultured Sanguibacteroides sp.]
MNKKNCKKIQYAAAIQTQLSEMLQDEECMNHLEDWEEHVTEFFTAINMATCNMYNQITGDKKTLLEFSYIVNQLTVQHVIEQREDK